MENFPTRNVYCQPWSVLKTLTAHQEKEKKIKISVKIETSYWFSVRFRSLGHLISTWPTATESNGSESCALTQTSLSLPSVCLSVCLRVCQSLSLSSLSICLCLFRSFSIYLSHYLSIRISVFLLHAIFPPKHFQPLLIGFHWHCLSGRTVDGRFPTVFFLTFHFNRLSI